MKTQTRIERFIKAVQSKGSIAVKEYVDKFDEREKLLLSWKLNNETWAKALEDFQKLNEFHRKTAEEIENKIEEIDSLKS